MGLDIDKSDFDDKDHTRFANELRHDLETLERLLSSKGWGEGPSTIGAELELYLTDINNRPIPCNDKVLSLARDPFLTTEINKFNVEYNCPYVPVKGKPFSRLKTLMDKRILTLQELVDNDGVKITPVGILPTLLETDFDAGHMTDVPRYQALIKVLRQCRGQPFHIEIEGFDSLSMDVEEATIEGANTSFQVHVRVNPDEFASWYNAIQLSSAFSLAMGANSPTFLGKKLWHETRIPLFTQSVDCRNPMREAHLPCRASFGQGYLRNSAIELFRQGIHLLPVLLPDWSDNTLKSPELKSAARRHTQKRESESPELRALRLHQSTIWYWNRPVYDQADGGHMRIELRSLPAGPTTIDMLANAALSIGLAQHFRHNIEFLMDMLPFEFARHNFFAAARAGIDAKFIWGASTGSVREYPVTDLLLPLLDGAANGLREIGIDGKEADKWIAVIERRIMTKQTGAVWQLSSLAHYEQMQSSYQALSSMFSDYRANCMSGEPVSDWIVH
ncbi:glutamate--cysteine ligase [Veronia nyctiphanis]|uniref:Glutamate--cysteine ligase n=1 Tax=Veronia nyctiphanis TaxID=1278244 RepID=A0A4Q0YUE7_9GAMM|nr:glutamate--cysteine ligase [Veronia nyctiphanis]RXJ74403.1 glutamate--cysteine ligase [Veronia nyctiphanis]